VIDDELVSQISMYINILKVRSSNLLAVLWKSAFNWKCDEGYTYP